MKHHLVIVEPVQIVALDLALAIRAFDPHAGITVYHSAAEALSALDYENPAAAFIHLEPEGSRSRVLLDHLQRRTIPFAVMGLIAQPLPDEVVRLASPFTELSVAAALRALLNPRAVPRAGELP